MARPLGKDWRIVRDSVWIEAESIGQKHRAGMAVWQSVRDIPAHWGYTFYVEFTYGGKVYRGEQVWEVDKP